MMMWLESTSLKEPSVLAVVESGNREPPQLFTT